MTEYIKHEREYVPWTVALRSMAYIGTMLSSRSSYELYQVIKLLVALDEDRKNTAQMGRDLGSTIIQSCTKRVFEKLLDYI